MKSVQKSLRIPEEIVKEVEELAETLGQNFSSVANRLLAEAVKMRRCPGIVFADGPTGRRARVAGSGLDVWEIVAAYQSLNQEFSRLQEAFHWLSEAQLRTALGYFTLYPQEIQRQIASNERWTKERLESQHPSLAMRSS
ncbi:hypothetical protein MYX65_09510 [Acidobacteria bacterium AH-259-L09]|nr:hypothetical protein [Acidobacteria bacterium AH-259-L09]